MHTRSGVDSRGTQGAVVTARDLKEKFMSNGIDFLERLGQDSGLRHAPEAVLERA
jgi:hypothetical protein